jgi:hypothetical protein
MLEQFHGGKRQIDDFFMRELKSCYLQHITIADLAAFCK